MMWSKHLPLEPYCSVVPCVSLMGESKHRLRYLQWEYSNIDPRVLQQAIQFVAKNYTPTKNTPNCIPPGMKLGLGRNGASDPVTSSDQASRGGHHELSSLRLLS